MSRHDPGAEYLRYSQLVYCASGAPAYIHATMEPRSPVTAGEEFVPRDYLRWESHHSSAIEWLARQSAAPGRRIHPNAPAAGAVGPDQRYEYKRILVLSRIPGEVGKTLLKRRPGTRFL